MKIKEIEAKAGIDRATIYYYEKEKLLCPHRTENGYREYGEEDLITLKRIRLLRSLHLTLDDIRSLMKGKGNLRDTLSRQIDQLKKEGEDISYAEALCRTIYNETPHYSDLDAEKYLKQIEMLSEEKGGTYFKVQDELPQVFDFRIRFIARLFDMTIYGLIWNSFRTFLLHQNVLKVYTSIDYLIMLIITLFMTLLLEPILLSLFRTTPGKALYGITIENQDGNRLSLEESFTRTWGVLSKGFAFGIIPLSVITLAISRTRCENGQIQPWDENISYKIRDYKYYRNLIVFLVFIFLLSANVLLSVVYYSPPNKGDLTVEEFVENFNHYREVYKIDLGEYTLKNSSAWDSSYDFRKRYLPTHLRNAPNFTYSLKNGIVTAVSFWLEVEDTEFWIDSYSNYMTLTALALTEPESIFDSALNADKIIDPIQWEPFKSYELSEMGVTIINEVEYEGFEDNYDHMRPERNDSGEMDNFYRQKFTVIRQ
ncbi:MAG TPA: MerR family transcriptional regulator [Proteiniclasticum sp.]|nr:MerR family transcriptional regulator [Proteiniclasticum sp.]